MHKRPYSEEDIEKIKDSVYIPPKPLHNICIIILTILFPFGLLYLLNLSHRNANNAVYLLSTCKTDLKRERFLAFLRKKPQCQHTKRRHAQRRLKAMNSFYVSDPSRCSYYSPLNALRQ